MNPDTTWRSEFALMVLWVLLNTGCASPRTADDALAGGSDSGQTQDGTLLCDGSPGGCNWSLQDATDGALPDAQSVGTIDIADSGLPMLPELVNIVATLRNDSVGIDFDPVDGAMDYRVYPLPTNPDDIMIHSDGSITIANAIYRCAGKRQGMDVSNSMNANDPSLVTVPGWATEISADPNIVGYVYVVPGAGRIPVYALAGTLAGNENGWRESRMKIYTTDAGEQQMLLSQGWRNDGIVFYVPDTASPSTQTIYSSQLLQMGPGFPFYQQYYFTSADVSMHSSDTTPPAPAFQVLTAATTGTQPLYSVYIQPFWQNHTELTVGTERFHRAVYQGNGPMWHVEWAGITQPTLLVVEALETGCPFQGFLAAQHVAGNASRGAAEDINAPPHQTFYTLADLQSASVTGEVFVNGEYDTTVLPRAVARSFINVGPSVPAAGDWDWYDGFHVGTDLGPATLIPDCLEGGAPGQSCVHSQTATYDISGYRLDEPTGVPVFTYGTFLGQLWSSFDDAGQDVTGKVRFTPLQTATISSDPNQYLHVTMSVNIPADDRRYPQLLVSDQPAPVQEGLSNPNQNTLIIQPIGGPSMRIEMQSVHGLINGAEWDVNNQMPSHTFIPSGYMDNLQGAPPSPVEPAFEHAGVDRMTRFDAYISSQRVYLLMDGTPAGCSEYLSPFALQGTVTVTFGDVLYHEGATDAVCGSAEMFSFSHFHNCMETDRRFDDVGFKSNVQAPTWNATVVPCLPY